MKTNSNGTQPSQCAHKEKGWGGGGLDNLLMSMSNPKKKRFSLPDTFRRQLKSRAGVEKKESFLFRSLEQ
jgi:hypothetical protein